LTEIVKDGKCGKKIFQVILNEKLNNYE